jgi:hypothetical protein
MIGTRIRPAAVLILICLVCLLVWFFSRQDDGGLAGAEDGPAVPGVKETGPLPSVPEWDRDPEMTTDGSIELSKSDGEFLATDYEPLEKWFNERFDIDYRQMTPELIFEQVPLNDIYYELIALPKDAPPFRLAIQDISRRDLLEKIADHWDLHMSLAVDESGQPTAVRVLAPGFYQ